MVISGLTNLSSINSFSCMPGLDRNIPYSLADKGRSSGTSGRTSTVSLGQKADRKAANVEEEHKLKDAKQQLNDMDKVQLNYSPSGTTVVLPASAHPDVDCVWRYSSLHSICFRGCFMCIKA